MYFLLLFIVLFTGAFGTTIPPNALQNGTDSSVMGKNWVIEMWEGPKFKGRSSYYDFVNEDVLGQWTEANPGPCKYIDQLFPNGFGSMQLYKNKHPKWACKLYRNTQCKPKGDPNSFAMLGPGRFDHVGAGFGWNYHDTKGMQCFVL